MALDKNEQFPRFSDDEERLTARFTGRDTDLELTDEKNVLKLRRKGIELEEIASQLETEMDDEFSTSSEEAELPQTISEILPSFFENISHIPDISEISEDASTIIHFVMEEKRASKRHARHADVGKFVDPLTGETIISEEEECQLDEEGTEEEDKVESEVEVPSEEPEDEDLLVLLEKEEPEKTVKPPGETVSVTFLDMDSIMRATVEDEADTDAYRRAASIFSLDNLTRDFVSELIHYAVEKCEYVSPRSILRNNLDKSKLMSELFHKLKTVESEQQVRMFLNRKAVEYFRRKKDFRAISDDHPDTVTADLQKYHTATKRLDSLLRMADDISKLCKEKELTLAEDCKELHWKESSACVEFENLVRTTLHREGNDRFNSSIDNLLQQISVLRSEVSDVRQLLIHRQHSYAHLKKKLDKLEDLGDGLHMRDFETLQTETLAISKKIEERNNELTKVRTRFNADLHIMAHMRERQHLMRETTFVWFNMLKELNAEKDSLRTCITELKTQRSKIRNEIRDLSIQGGLLDKPALMIDYDDTMERLTATRIHVGNMKMKQQTIQRKIDVLEATQKTTEKRGREMSIEFYEEAAIYTNDYYGNITTYMPL